MTPISDANPVTTDDIEALIDRAMASGQLPLAGVLNALAGAMLLGREGELLKFLVPFSEEGLKRATEGLSGRS